MSLPFSSLSIESTFLKATKIVSTPEDKTSFSLSQNPDVPFSSVSFKVGPPLSRHLQWGMYLEPCLLAANPVIEITGSSYLSSADSQFGVLLSSRIWQLLETHFFLENVSVVTEKLISLTSCLCANLVLLWLDFYAHTFY